MRVLAFDTTMAALSVAIHESGRGIVSTMREEMETGQAERLLPGIDDALRAAALPLSEIDRLIVTRGPGTFTGIRIGLAVARGLRLARGLPVVSISSLTAIAAGMAQRLPPAGGDADCHPDRLIVALTARGSGAYFAVFDRDAAPLADPALLQPHEFMASLDRSASYLVGGSAAAALSEAATAAGLDLSITTISTGAPDAADFAHLAETLPETTDLAPLYLREPDAKPQPMAAIVGGAVP